MTKSISCGVIITDGTHIVLGHTTNGKFWDIPKGGMDKGETYLQTAIRELHEETGLQIDSTVLVPLKIYHYRPKKDLMLFIWSVTTMPDPTTLFCKSEFTNEKKQKQPELDAFMIATFDQASTLLNPDLARIVMSVKGEYIDP